MKSCLEVDEAYSGRAPLQFYLFSVGSLEETTQRWKARSK